MSFKAITIDDSKGILCTLLKKRNKILEVHSSHFLKDLESLTIKQKEKKVTL